jgi:hypothetical protein
VERAGGLVRNIGSAEQFEPKRATLKSKIEHAAGGLTDGPQETEVRDRGSGRGGPALEDHYALAGTGGDPRVGEADDAGTRDDDLCVVFGHDRSLYGLAARPKPDERKFQNLRDHSLGQRSTMTFLSVKNSMASRPCACITPKKLPFQPENGK